MNNKGREEGKMKLEHGWELNWPTSPARITNHFQDFATENVTLNLQRSLWVDGLALSVPLETVPQHLH